MQITRSWHGEVATRNIDGVQRAGRRSWRRPARRQGGRDAYFRERDDDNFIDVKYMHHHWDPTRNLGPCLIFLGGIQGAEIPARPHSPILRAVEQHAGGGHRGAPKSGLGPLFRGPRYRPVLACADRPKLRASEKRTGRGHQGAPKKRPWPAIWGSQDTGPRPSAARPILRAAEQHAGGGHQGAPKKRLGTAIRGYKNAGLPCYISEQVDEKSV